MAKTKQIVREKYWYPSMNRMIEQIIGYCYACQVTTKPHRNEPVKVTDIPKKPWDVVAVDFSAPYPDGLYNLMAVKKRTRYPEVAKTHSTTSKPTMEKLKTIFFFFGKLKSDNVPPFNSREFAKFTKTEGFHHQ